MDRSWCPVKPLSWGGTDIPVCVGTDRNVCATPGFSVEQPLDLLSKGGLHLLEVNANVRVPESEFEWTYVRSSGPGGQNVNKVASKAVMRWDAKASPSVPEAVKQRLFAHHRGRFTVEGVLVLTSQRFRDQERNRQDCLEKLHAWLLAAATPPTPRKATRPSPGSKERRLQGKKKRASTKAQRKPKFDD